MFLPKYARGVSGTVRFSKIARALERYWRSGRGKAVGADEVHDLRFASPEPSRQYDLYSTLRDRFLARGLYKPTRRVQGHDARHRIRWPKTIATTPAVYSNGSCVYPSPTIEGLARQPNLVTSIHASTLVALDDKFRMSAAEPLRASLSDETEIINKEHLSRDSEFWARRLRAELSGVYESEDIDVLDALVSFFDEERTLQGPGAVRLYGTTAFHAVWEAALSSLFEGSESNVTGRLSQPRWDFRWPREETVEGGRQRPDVLAVSDDCVLVLDAKYYYPLPDSLCGWSDLVKQFFYSKSYDGRADLRVFNGLVFPDPNTEDIEAVGEIVMARPNRQRDERFEKIHVIKANPDKVLDAFATGRASRELASKMRALAALVK